MIFFLYFIEFCLLSSFHKIICCCSFRARKGPKVLLAVMVSRVLLVCLVLLVLKAHQERMVTRSDSCTYLFYPATSVFPQHFLLRLDNNVVAFFTTNHRSFFGVNADVHLFRVRLESMVRKEAKETRVNR